MCRPGAALTSARRPCLHFHCAFWFTCQAARAHVALLGPCFKTGRTRPSDYQRRWRTSGALRREISATVSTARSPHRTVHSRREAPPCGVRHGGQGAAHVPRSHRSIVRQGCKLSMRDVPSSTHLPLSPCRSGLTAAGPRSRGVRHCLGRPARDGLRRRVGALGRA